MLVNLRNNRSNFIFLLGILFTVMCFVLSGQPNYLWLLTVAQLIFVPTMVSMVVDVQKVGTAITMGMMLAVTLPHWSTDGVLANVLAGMYVLYTFYIAMQGVKRFYNEVLQILRSLLSTWGFST